MNHNGILNSLAWMLAATGGLAFVASSIGVIYCLFTLGHRSATELTAVDLSLHDSYYIIRHSRSIIWPLLLCVALSAAITIIGYVHTEFHMVRMMRDQPGKTAKV